MSETTMPATEAQNVAVPATEEDDARNSYECAFHVLPTVADGEVADVFDGIKTSIRDAGGEIILDEAPERIDLAYEITKQIEGVNRKFKSAYFGWVRFTLSAEAVTDLEEGLAAHKKLLRHLVIRLRKEEEAQPYYFHENHKKPQSETVDIEAKPTPEKESAPDVQVDVEGEAKQTAEASGEVSEDELDKSLEKITKEK